MSMQMLELEGTWEEIAAHAEELAGRRVRLTILPMEAEEATERSLPSANARMLEALAAWEQTPLREQERAVLDELEQHLKEHPFSLGQVGDDQ